MWELRLREFNLPRPSGGWSRHGNPLWLQNWVLPVMSRPLLQGKPVPALGFPLQTMNLVSWGLPLAATAAQRFCLCSPREPGIGQRHTKAWPQREPWGHKGISGTEGAAPLTPPLFVYLFVEVELIYSVVLVSGVQQSDSVIHIYIFLLFF